MEYKKKFGLLENNSFIENYKEFLNSGKTERLCIERIEYELANSGFENIEVKETISIGDKVYLKNKNKGIIAMIVSDFNDLIGANFVFSHIDSPHLDLKPVPFFKERQLAYFKTHYYGGIKKYQWLTLPLALYGVVYKSDGTKVNLAVGDEPSDPVFYISDLLPHLSNDQMKKIANDIVDGEQLNVIIGTAMDNIEGSQTILEILYDKYGIIEEDLISAELQIVPAGQARDVGFDKSLLLSYGHDDRVSAYCSLMALCSCDVTNIEKDAIAVFVDKEEVGSFSHSGAQSNFWMDFIHQVFYKKNGVESDLTVQKFISNSLMISADVNAAYDPMFPEAFELRNTAELGAGVVITKYTGEGGKSATNDSDAEVIFELRNKLNSAKIAWNIGELGKIDQSWGGTISRFLVNRNAYVVDLSISVLSMHAPFELVSNFDVYQLYQGLLCIYQSEYTN